MEREIAIEVKNLYISYRNLQKFSIKQSLLHFKKVQADVFQAVKDVSFEVEKGEILGIIGKNGSGKSTMLKALAGIFSPDTGSIDLKNHSVSLRFENHIFYSTVTADVDFQVKFPIRFLGSDQPVVLKMHSRSVAPVTDTPEFIQNVDMAIDYADSTGLSEKLNQLTGKVREFFGR